jgi:transcriptional regulator with XRE-family HTH domain
MKTDPKKVVWSELTQGLRAQLGTRIVNLRLERGMSQSELADLLAVPRGRVSKWEGGYNAPPPEDLVALSGVFEVSVDELLTGKKAIFSRELCAEIAEHVAALRKLIQ